MKRLSETLSSRCRQAHGGQCECAEGGDRGDGPVSALYAADVQIPAAGESIRWNGSLRLELPEYAKLQLDAACYWQRCTLGYVILEMMHGQTDAAGRPLFYIREEDLVRDRRRKPQRDDAGKRPRNRSGKAMDL